MIQDKDGLCEVGKERPLTQVEVRWNAQFTQAESNADALRALAELGVRRISVGGALARAAWAGFMSAARTMIEQGRFDGLRDALSGAELDERLRSNRSGN